MPDLTTYYVRVSESKCRRKEPLTPENGPTSFSHVLAVPRLIDASHVDFAPGLGDPKNPFLDAVPADYVMRYPRVAAIQKIKQVHLALCQRLPAGHWENSFLVAPAPENITSKPEDLVSRPPNRYCFRWETAARRLSTELGRDIRPAYAAIETSEYWKNQIRYHPCYVEGYDLFVEYDTALGVPVTSWYQGFSEAQLRIQNYTDYRREATIKCWEIANQRIEGNNQDE